MAKVNRRAACFPCGTWGNVYGRNVTINFRDYERRDGKIVQLPLCDTCRCYMNTLPWDEASEWMLRQRRLRAERE